ncbi:MAG: hypothetical protein JRN34_05905 [Nitrososphaerota archaeon]|nr:hypothetical protein [Nitrososphaerota archaeon]MDG6942899.1 hypothetical protein [Nitrososphaerota archaeon]
MFRLYGPLLLHDVLRMRTGLLVAAMGIALFTLNTSFNVAAYRYGRMVLIVCNGCLSLTLAGSGPTPAGH